MSAPIEYARHDAPSATHAARRSLEAISILALYVTIIAALFIITPFISVPLTTTKTFLLGAGAIVTLVLYLLARLARGNVVLPPFKLMGALWLPVAAYALSAAFSGVPFSQALWGSALEADTLGFMLAAAVLGTLLALLVRRNEQYGSFLKLSFVAFGVLAVVQLVFVIVGQFAPSLVAPTASLVGSYPDLALLLGLGIIAILITLRSIELTRTAHHTLAGVGAISLILLAIANSAFVWALVALVSLGLFVEAVLLQHRSKAGEADLDETLIIDEAPTERDGKGRSLLMPLVALAVSLFFLIGGNIGNYLSSSLHASYMNVTPSWQATFSVVNQVYAHAPLFGSGPDTFGAQWLKYRDASLNSTVFWNVDFASGIGFIPTALVTTGLAGFLAWAGLLALLAWFGYRMLISRAPEDPFTRYVALLSFVATLYLFAAMIFSVPGTFVIMLAFLFAGVFASTTRFARGARQWGVIFARSPRIGFVIVFAFTIVLLSSIVAAYALAEHYLAVTQLAKAADAYAAGDLENADRAAQNAIVFAPTPAAYQVEATIMNARLGQIAQSTSMAAADAQKAFQTALSTGINSALTATRLAPNNYQNWLTLGNLYGAAVPLGVSGAYDGAKAAYDKAAALDPTNPAIPYIQAQLDIANKDTAAAEKDLKTAIALKQDYTAAIFLLSQLEVREGKVKEALDSALAAAYFTPNEPNILFQVGILYAAQNDLQNAAAALDAAVKANSQFANARYVYAAVLAKQGNLKDAQGQMQAIADMSAANAKAVASQIADLSAGKNPFPANLLSLPSAPVQ